MGKEKIERKKLYKIIKRWKKEHDKKNEDKNQKR